MLVLGLVEEPLYTQGTVEFVQEEGIPLLKSSDQKGATDFIDCKSEV